MVHMGEPVPLAAFLSIIVVDQIVVDVRTEANVPVNRLRSLEQWRFSEADFCVQAKYLAALHQPRGFHHPFGRKQVQATEFVVRAEDAPGRFRRQVSFDRQLLETG